MSTTADETRLQEHISQLNVIVARRNEFLRELFQIMRSRQDLSAAAAVDDDDDDLLSFLDRFNLEKDAERGSISNLSEEELDYSFHPFPPSENSSAAPSVVESKPSSSTRATRSRSRVNDVAPFQDKSRRAFPLDKAVANLTSPSPSRDLLSPKYGQSFTPREDEDSDVDNDELDLIGSKPTSGEITRAIVKPVAEPSTPTKVDVREERKEGVNIFVRSVETIAQETLVEEAEDISGISPVLEVRQTPADLAEAATEDVEMKGESDHPAEEETPESPKDESMDVEEDEVAAITQAGDQETVEQEPVSPKLMDVTEAPEEPSTSASVTITNGAPPEEPPEEPIHPATLPMNYVPIKLIFPPCIHEPILIPTPSTAAHEKLFQLDLNTEPETRPLISPPGVGHPQFNPQYVLPPLSVLPVEFTRKAKSLKRKKKDPEPGKEREREGKRDKDDTVPMGLARWGATVTANPVWKKVARATKCLSTREWSVAMTELRLIRTIERINSLKDDGRWSFRQPKKQRGVGGSVKSHWDYLMEEMKWMRIDFREERRWKMALAYNLSTAVLEWHFAKTPEARHQAGIVVKWKRPHVEENENEDEFADSSAMDISQDSEPAADKPSHTLLGVDYGSDDDEDDEPEKDRRSGSVVDALEPAAVIQEALDGTQEIQPKNEEVDDQAALHLMQAGDLSDAAVDTPSGMDTKLDSSRGLKSSSDNPVLGGSKSSSQSTNGDNDAPPVSTKFSKSLLAPLRERITYDDDLFLDLAVASSSSTTLDGPELEHRDTLDLTTLFPDLQPLNILELSAGPVLSVPDGKRRPEKKSDKDDPTRRPDDFTYTKLYPTGRYMHSKPTLIGPLQPAKRYRDGKWFPVDPQPVAADTESGNRIPEESSNELFEGRPSNASSSLALGGSRKRADHLWSAADDMLLKQLVDRYSTNWALISECYNSSRLTTPTERRTPADCSDRWKERWGPAERKIPTFEATLPPSATEDVPSTPGISSGGVSSSPMTTRNVKRLASASISSGQGVPMGSEPKKRRRHALLQDSMKRTAKKRQEALQKMQANQRKPSAVHETHNQYNKLPKLTPMDLARLKADKDQRENQELLLARKRQEEQMRANLMREQAQRANAPITPQLQAQLQAQQQAQQQQQQAGQQQQQPAPTQPQQQGQGQPAQAQSQTQAPAPQAALTPQQQQQQIQQHIQQAQLAQLQQLQAQQQATQAARVNAAAAAARPTRLTATPNARPVNAQAQAQQAQLLQQARGIPLQLPPGAQANLVQALSQAQASGSAAGNPYYQLPANLGSFTQEQLLNAIAMQNAVQQQQHAQQQQQQQQQATQGQQQNAPNGFTNNQS